MVEHGKVQTYALLHINDVSIKLGKKLIFKKEVEK